MVKLGVHNQTGENVSCISNPLSYSSLGGSEDFIKRLNFRCCRCLICHRYPLALLIKFIGESLHPATASLNIQDPTCCDKHIRSGSLCGPSSAYGSRRGSAAQGLSKTGVTGWQWEFEQEDLGVFQLKSSLKEFPAVHLQIHQ